MKKLSITTVSLAALALSCVQPAVAGFDNTFVDFAGSDSANTCGVITSPCATLNNALANTNATGSVNILNGGFWGPILITQSVNINAFEGKAVIINDGSAPGCVGAAAGSCGSNGGYAIEIAGTTSTNVKMKGVSIRQGTGSGGALKIGTANQVKLADSNLRGSSSATLPMLDIVPANGNAPTQFQLVLANVDVAYSAGAAIRVLPSGSTAVRLLADRLQVHNASAGIRLDASSLTGSGNIVGSVSNSFFFSFQNAGINVVAPSGANKAAFGSAKSVFTNVGGQGLRAIGAGASVALSDDVVTGNNIGIQAVTSGTIVTFKNNSVGGNAVDFDTAGGTVIPITPF